MNYRTGLTIFSLLILFKVSAQSEIVNLGGAAFLSLGSELPKSLTSERSLVVIDIPTQTKEGFEVRGKWQELAKKAHVMLKRIGIDAIAYVYQGDLNAGPEVSQAYLSLFEKRNVKNLIMIKCEGEYPNELFSLIVTSYFPNSYVQNGQIAWQVKHPQFDQLMVRLGKQVLRQEIERSNFLIPDEPDFVTDLVVFTGNRLENYPSRLRSNKLAVVAFQRVSTNDVSGSAESMAAITAYNKKIDQMNAELEIIMEKYPFKYDIVTESNEDALYDAGYQYSLVPLTSTGSAIKKLLNYPVLRSETHYMTSGFDEEKKVSLKKIPIGAIVTKYYIKQTIVKDVHTGKVWDADVSWQKALENFLFNINEAF